MRDFNFRQINVHATFKKAAEIIPGIDKELNGELFDLVVNGGDVKSVGGDYFYRSKSGENVGLVLFSLEDIDKDNAREAEENLRYVLKYMGDSIKDVRRFSYSFALFYFAGLNAGLDGSFLREISRDHAALHMDADNVEHSTPFLALYNYVRRAHWQTVQELRESAAALASSIVKA